MRPLAGARIRLKTSVHGPIRSAPARWAAPHRTSLAVCSTLARAVGRAPGVGSLPGPPSRYVEGGMIELTRSKEALALASIASVIWALGDALAVCAYATYSGPQDTSSFRNLAIASDWLLFVSGFVVLCATSFVTWHLYVERRWTAMWEVAGTAVSTLIFAIGLLILAAPSPSGSTAGDVVAAVGLGGWAVVMVFSAARTRTGRAGNAWIDASGRATDRWRCRDCVSCDQCWCARSDIE